MTNPFRIFKFKKISNSKNLILTYSFLVLVLLLNSDGFAEVDCNTSKSRVDQAECFIRQKQLEKAERILSEFVSNVPKGWTPLREEEGTILGAFWNMSDFTSYVTKVAIPNGKEAKWVGESYSRAYFYLSFISTERRDLAKSLKYLELGLELEPDHPCLLSEKALVLSNQGRHDAALELYKEAVSLRSWISDHDMARALRGQGFELVELGDLVKAEAAYKKSLKFEPNSRIAISELALIEKQWKNPTSLKSKVVTTSACDDDRKNPSTGCKPSDKQSNKKIAPAISKKSEPSSDGKGEVSKDGKVIYYDPKSGPQELMKLLDEAVEK